MHKSDGDPNLDAGPLRAGAVSGSDDVAMAVLTAGLLVGQQVVAKAVRDTVFLAAVGLAWLPQAMVGGALLSAAVAVGVSRIAPSLGARRTLRVGLIASASLFSLSWLMFGVSARSGALLAYFHSAALTAACVSAFWTQLTESFDPHAARRVVVRVMSGATLGGVLGGLVTWRMAALAAPRHLLLACAALNVATIVCASRIVGNVRPPQQVQRPPSWRSFRRERPYLRALAGVVLLAAASQAILDYLLSSAAVSALGRGPHLLAFFALFQTVVGMLSFLVQTSLSAAALERLGIGGALAARSACLVAGSLAAPFVAPLSAAVALRGTDGVLGSSLERSAYEVLFTPLASAKRRASKALVDVAADRLGTLSGAALVSILVALAGSRSFHVLLAIVVVLGVAHGVVSRMLQSRYRHLLADNLRSGRPGASRPDALDPAGAWQSAALDLDSSLGLSSSRSPSPAARAQPLGVSLAAFDLPAGPDLDPEPEAQDEEERRARGGAAATPADAVVADFAALRSREPDRALPVLSRRGSEPLLAAQVIELLDDDRLAQAAADWLSALHPTAAGQLEDALLDPARPDPTRRRVARILGKSGEERAAEALLDALTRVPPSVRLGVAQALARLSKTRPLASARVLDALLEVSSAPSWAGDDERLETLFCLLAAAYPGEPVPAAFHGLLRGGELRGTALEWLDALLPHDVKASLWPKLIRTDERLQRTERSLGELGRTLEAAPRQEVREEA